MIQLLKKYNIFIIIGVFIILYNPPILPVNSMHLVGFLSIVFLIVNVGDTYSKLCYVPFLRFCLFIIIWGIYLLLIILMNGTNECDYIVPIYFLVDVIPFALAILKYSQSRKLNSDDFVNLLIGTGLIQAITAVLAFFVSSVQQLFVQLLINYGYGEVYSSIASWRLYGLSGTLTFETPVIQSILAVVVIYKIMKSFSIWSMCSAILLAFSAIINARTSFVVLAIGIVLLLMLSEIRMSGKIFILVIGMIVVIAFMYFVLPWLSHYAIDTYRWISEGFDDISGFFAGNYGEYSYFKYATNAEKYRLPSPIIKAVFGTGHKTIGMMSLYGYSSDVGYTNDIWLGGLTYEVCIIGYFQRCVWLLYRKSKGIVSALGLLLLILFPILNIKGLAYTMNGFFNMFMMLYIITYLFQIDREEEIVVYGKL